MKQAEIFINNELHAYFCLPDDAADQQLPAVLMLHGFASDANEVADFYVRLSEQLASIGVASLRLNFRGCGKSSGDYADLSVEKMIEDTQAGIDYLTQHSVIDSEQLSLCGFSLGAAIAILFSQRQPDLINNMILLSPVGNLVDDFGVAIGETVVSEALGSSAGNQVLFPYVANGQPVTMTLTTEFFKSLLSYDIYDAIKSYQGDMLVIAGSNDFSYKHALAFESHAEQTLCNVDIIDGADHIFNIFDPDKNYSQDAMQLITQFFLQTNALFHPLQHH